MLVPAERIKINLMSYEVQILNDDFSLKKMGKVSNATVWRLVKMWSHAHKDWRCLEWNSDQECIALFRHRRKKELRSVMPLREYLKYEI